MKSFRDRDFGAVSTLALTLALAFGVSLFSREESRAQSGTVASAMCEMAFVRIRGSEATPRPLTMDARYRGEHLGTYLDPITKEPWMVKYFDRMERDSLEVHYKNGVFVDAKGQKLNSNFDAESLTFDEALIVVSKSYHIFVYPRDERGLYHHSSILSGADVMFAGMASFSEGRIRVLTDRSGHYAPTPEHTRWFIRLLWRSGVDLTGLTLMGRAAQHFGATAAMRPKEIRDVFLQ
jgi:hypothetical protein